MKELLSSTWLLSTAIAVPLLGTIAQASAPTPAPGPSVAVSVPVASYGNGSISKVELSATEIAPRATGGAKLSLSKGSVTVSVSVKGLPVATTFGPEYLTYVVWAVTAEGRPRNLGEVFVDEKGTGKFEASTQAPAFGIVVTAEPYFAVGAPSELVVLRNRFAAKDVEKAPPSDVQFQAFAKDTYSGEGIDAPDPKSGLPPDLYQARNAVRIAKSFRADSFASDPYSRAARSLEQAEALGRDKNKQKKNMAAPKSREAVQSAEAARSLAVRKIDEARVVAEKAEADARTAEAQAAKAEEALRRAQAELSAGQAQAAADDEARRRETAESAAGAAARPRRRSSRCAPVSSRSSISSSRRGTLPGGSS